MHWGINMIVEFNIEVCFGEWRMVIEHGTV
jgi:hypothetical protein